MKRSVVGVTRWSDVNPCCSSFLFGGVDTSKRLCRIPRKLFIIQHVCTVFTQKLNIRQCYCVI